MLVPPPSTSQARFTRPSAAVLLELILVRSGAVGRSDILDRGVMLLQAKHQTRAIGRRRRFAGIAEAISCEDLFEVLTHLMEWALDFALANAGAAGPRGWQ
jgi:hypothetical protein